MKLSSLIIHHDDEIVKTIEKLIKKYSNFSILKSVNNSEEAIDNSRKYRTDIIYIATDLPNVCGFDILEKIDYTPIVIFISPNEKEAIKAFDFLTFDFLTTPLNEKRFEISIKKIESFKKNQNSSSIKKIESLIQNFPSIKTPNIFEKKINIKSGNKTILLERDNIKYISASGYYVEIHTTDNKKYLLRESLKGIINRLNSNEFIRIHRSTIINSNFIDEIISSSYGETDVKIANNLTFRVSKGYKKQFQELVGEIN